MRAFESAPLAPDANASNGARLFILNYDPSQAVQSSDRLNALLRTELLDTPAEEAFDRLTRLAARLLDVPVSLVSLVDKDRQFFKSHCGLPEPWASARETPLSHSFCQYAVAQAEPLIVRDARDHPLVSENLAITDLNVIAYAGIPLITSDGHILGSFCAIDSEPRDWTEDQISLLRDLADSVVTEIELRAAIRESERKAKEAEDAARARDEMMAIVSHDLRDPLNTVRLSIGLMLDILPQGELREFELRQLAIIRRAAERMEKLIQDLLDVTRIEAGRLSIEPQPVRVGQVLSDAVEAFRPRAQAAALELTTEAAGESEKLYADRDRLLQVFSNLIGNAMKFTPEGGSISVRAYPQEDGFRFEVADTGPGIPPEHLPHLFDRFWQANNAARSGAGLGLAICKGIVEAHGGTLWVESTPGEGSTFSFILPKDEPAV